MKILVAEDDPIALRLACSFLEKWGYDIVAVSDGLEAWEILQKPDAPKLLLLDWIMPGMDGLDICRKVRKKADENSGYTYILMITSKGRKEDFIEGLEAGVDDYLRKPFDVNELKIRLRTARRMLELQQQLMDSRTELKNRHKQEVDIGAKIQETLLLAQPPSQIGRLQIAAVNEPSEEIGGDFYEFIPHGEDCLDVIVGDVMGKGVPAALLGAATKTHLVRAVNELLVNKGTDALPDPQEIVMTVHRQMTHHMIDMGLFLTVFYARINLQTDMLEFVDCGHTHALYYSKKTGQTSALTGENMPLGFTTAETYLQNSLAISQGDILMFYSDGVTEAIDTTGEMFGQARVAQILQAQAEKTPSDIIHTLLEEIENFSGSNKFSDDLTCVAVKVE